MWQVGKDGHGTRVLHAHGQRWVSCGSMSGKWQVRVGALQQMLLHAAITETFTHVHYAYLPSCAFIHSCMHARMCVCLNGPGACMAAGSITMQHGRARVDSFPTVASMDAATATLLKPPLLERPRMLAQLAPPAAVAGDLNAPGVGEDRLRLQEVLSST